MQREEEENGDRFSIDSWSSLRLCGPSRLCVKSGPRAKGSESAVSEGFDPIPSSELRPWPDSGRARDDRPPPIRVIMVWSGGPGRSRGS